MESLRLESRAAAGHGAVVAEAGAAARLRGRFLPRAGRASRAPDVDVGEAVSFGSARTAAAAAHFWRARCGVAETQLDPAPQRSTTTPSSSTEAPATSGRSGAGAAPRARACCAGSPSRRPEAGSRRPAARQALLPHRAPGSSEPSAATGTWRSPRDRSRRSVLDHLDRQPGGESSGRRPPKRPSGTPAPRRRGDRSDVERGHPAAASVSSATICAVGAAHALHLDVWTATSEESRNQTK